VRDHELRERPTIRVAIFLGFGLIFTIWLSAGYYFTRRIADVERQSASISARYVRAQELLSTVRGQVLVGSVYVRDALLDPDPTTASEYRRRLEDSYRVIGQALDQYVPVLDSEGERQQLLRLRTEIDDFRTTMLEVLATDTSRWATEARTVLRSRVVPKRERVIGLSEQVQTMNRGAFMQQQSAITDVYRISQHRIWQSVGVALLASLGIALFAVSYVGRLEGRIRRQGATEAQNARDLQHLSAKLITAQEEERRTIARELHDEVGQVLTAIKVQLAVAQHEIETTGASSTTALVDARSITEGALQTVRDLSHLLHPSVLDDLGLPVAVHFYLREFSKRHGIRGEMVHDRMEERFTPEVETSAYRIVQEALTNVAKHARANSCRVYLQRLPNTVLITIEDDGVGFEAAEVADTERRSGLGLIGIRERAAQLQGTVRIESVPGKGTRLTVELPARPRIAMASDIQPIGRTGELAING
jgi:signal transduction histidine kinase